MSTQNEPNVLSDLVLMEESAFKYSREAVTVISGQNLAVGTVVGKITASGKVTILAPAASDGSQTAYGVLLEAVDASAADKPGVVIRRFGIVKLNNLVWPGGITAGQKATALSQLESMGVIARTNY